MKRYLSRFFSMIALGIIGAAICLLVSQTLYSNTVSGSEKHNETMHYNRLAKEKSPYLLQHAENPVNWYPWGPEAFEKALKENKPIFLSIGYSTCHWCHVMAHESFEDAEVAKLMNDVFISIKVDREERPDIDNIYMDVCQIMTGSGGWPLTIIMTPDMKPFFAGTYIPKTSRFKRLGMTELIPRVKALWTNDNDEMLKTANSVIASLQQPKAAQTPVKLGKSALNAAYDQLCRRFDKQNAGFGREPKFPSPQNILFLLRYWKRTGDKIALNIIERTLQAMRMGGIYDHVGFGFHRYSTDAKWIVPHYEKMLYDQALLAMAYVEAYQATGKDEYQNTAREIFAYVKRDMTSPEGGFYSAEDADSEGEEGLFYLWTADEIRQKLPKKDAELIIKAFNIREPGKVTKNEHDELSGKTLHLNKSYAELAVEFKMAENDLAKIVVNSMQKLFVEREKRIHPHKDDKILTDWNGLMIAALAKGARVLNDDTYAEAAKRAVDFVVNKMRGTDNRLLHRYRDGDAAQLAYVDDYSFLIWGLLELYETTFDANYLKTALELNTDLFKHFLDEKGGAFYFTADDSEKLLIRQKEFYDGAVPSGNSVAMLNILRLARITGDVKLENSAFRISGVFSQLVKQTPSAYAQFMTGLDFAIGESYEIVVVGNSAANDTKEMLKALRSYYVPNKVVIFKPTEKENPDIVKYAGVTKNQKSIGNKATAYVCLNYSCKPPTTDINKMLELIKAK